MRVPEGTEGLDLGPSLRGDDESFRRIALTGLNLAASNTQLVSELATAIEEWRGGRVRLDVANPENMELIRALGYVE